MCLIPNNNEQGQRRRLREQPQQRRVHAQGGVTLELHLLRPAGSGGAQPWYVVGARSGVKVVNVFTVVYVRMNTKIQPYTHRQGTSPPAPRRRSWRRGSKGSGPRSGPRTTASARRSASCASCGSRSASRSWSLRGSRRRSSGWTRRRRACPRSWLCFE